MHPCGCKLQLLIPFCLPVEITPKFNLSLEKSVYQGDRVCSGAWLWHFFFFKKKSPISLRTGCRLQPTAIISWLNCSSCCWQWQHQIDVLWLKKGKGGCFSGINRGKYGPYPTQIRWRHSFELSTVLHALHDDPQSQYIKNSLEANPAVEKFYIVRWTLVNDDLHSN